MNGSEVLEPPKGARRRCDPSHQQPDEGIGLSIVKRLCELPDASLEMASSAETGTTLTRENTGVTGWPIGWARCHLDPQIGGNGAWFPSRSRDLVSGMPTLLRIRGFRFYIYAHEGTEPAHVHIDKGAGTMKVWLNDVSIASSEGLKPSEIRAALALTRKHRTLLLNAWNEFQSRKS